MSLNCRRDAPMKPGKKLLSGLQAERRTWSPGSFLGSGWHVRPLQATVRWAAGPASDLSGLDRRAPTSPEPSGARPAELGAPTHALPLAGGTSLLPHCSVCICWAVSLHGSLEGRSRP